MKRHLSAISILIAIFIAFLFSVPKRAYATDCCLTNQTPENDYCLIGTTGIHTPNQCSVAEPYCNTAQNKCAMIPLANCDAAGDCTDASYRQNHNGCVPSGFSYVCSFTTLPGPTPPTYTPPAPTIDTSSRFCNGRDVSGGINTALGCIKVASGTDLVTTILRLATGLGGGLALALILYGVFIVTTSAGMPDKLKAGSEIITSAVIGLIFILLSVFLVNLIGINILGIPGLT